VVGKTQASAEAALRQAGFAARVISDAECNPADVTCDYRQGVVWAQSPAAGSTANEGTIVTIRVNP
jgi:beta-lactam-binding protein with PASTA domain